MSKSYPRSLTGFVDTLEKRARTARAISISISIGIFLLSVSVLLFAIWQIRKQIHSEQAQLEIVREERVKAGSELAGLRQEYDLTLRQLILSRAALGELPPEKREALLQKAQQINQVSEVPKVFLHILDNGQRGQAIDMSNMLKKNNFKVQGVEWVRVPVTLKQTQVKYFRPEYADDAQRIIVLLKQSGIQATSVSLNAAAGQIEVWFSGDAFPKPKEPSTQEPASTQMMSLAQQAYEITSKLSESLRAGSPAEKAQVITKLQRIVSGLERDKELISFVKSAGISSADTDGERLLDKLRDIRVDATISNRRDLVHKINQITVVFGK